MTKETLKYTIFKTKWGWFGLSGTENSLLRTSLPGQSRKKIKTHLLKNLPAAEHDKSFFGALQEQIIAYFEGTYVDFGTDIGVRLKDFSRFAEDVLLACRDIRFGQTTSYAQLAKMVARPTAVRAIGGTLAKNPLPLIIPCHRIICSSGRIGGFSATGGAKFKEKLLLHEQSILR